MVDLTDVADELIFYSAARTKPVAALEARVRSRRRRRRRGAAGIALSAAAVVVVALLALPGSRRQSVTVTGPPPTAPTVSPTPPGYHRVNYGNASIAAPASWDLLQAEEVQCPAPAQVVLLGNAEQGNCGSQSPGPLSSFARLQPLPASLPAGRPVVINGHSGIKVPSSAGNETYLFPDLGVELTVAGQDSANITETVGWSATYLLLHPAGPIEVPHGWRKLQFDGVDVKVPPSWPVVQLGTTTPTPGVCANPEFPRPVVDEGPGGPQPCNGFGPSAPVAETDGIWLRTYTFAPIPGQLGPDSRFPPSGSQILQPSPHLVALLPTINNGQQVVQLVAQGRSGQKIAIDIGLGPNPTTAQEVLASITGTTYLPQTTEPTVTTPTTVKRQPVYTTAVPQLAGLTETTAKTVLANAGLNSQVKATISTSVPAGDVISQTPSPGSVVATGSTIELEVSSGPPKAPQT